MKIYTIETRSLCSFNSAIDMIVEGLWKETDFQKAEQYAKDMESGDIFPPIEVTGEHVTDGFHRLYAYRLLGVREVEVINIREHMLRELEEYETGLEQARRLS